jgi:hypothetical protein
MADGILLSAAVLRQRQVMPTADALGDREKPWEVRQRRLAADRGWPLTGLRLALRGT